MNSIASALLVVTLVASSVGLGRSSSEVNLARHIYPLAKPLASPIVVLDASQVPSEREWGELAKQLVVDWYPTVTTLLATEKFQAPQRIRLVLVKDMAAPAATSGADISISGKWIHEHPDDFGMVVHELAHVVQAYPGSSGDYGWLVEGIADYVRWWRYEPEQPRPTVEKGQTWRDGYRTTAAFLAWSMRTYDMRLVSKLDLTLRTGGNPADVFAAVTGRSFEKAWDEYVADRR